MSLTLEEAKGLKPGDILHDDQGKRWKVNGRVKLWKTFPHRIYVPLKHGLYTYEAIDESDFPLGTCWLLTKGEPQ